MSLIPQYISKSTKPEQLQLLMNEAIYILNKFGVPLDGISQRRLERIAMGFLAVANVKENNDWIRSVEC